MDDFENELERVTALLNQGKIILYPTDTIWGIGCDAANTNAIKRIYELKRREEKKSLIILVNNVEMIYDYVNEPNRKLLSYLKGQKHPTTCIFDNAKRLPDILVNQDNTIAIRIVEDKFCKLLISNLKKPMVSTSANISGEKFPQDFLQVSDMIKTGVDYIVQHRQNDFSKSMPSSIIRLNKSGEITKLR